MKLSELISAFPQAPEQSVPDTMLGCFRRRCISFANGESDNQTIVYWFQSRNFTIDLRLPRASEQVGAAALDAYTKDELAVMANYEGWVADCSWINERMSWHGGTALQTTDRWPEPAELRRIGNCMIEFAPSGAYVEDWRLQPSLPGPLIGLKLIEEVDADSGQRHPRAGGLIICGDHAALVLGRSEPLPETSLSLPEMTARADGDTARLKALFDFESSVASGSLDEGYTIGHSTRPDRMGQPLLPESDFHYVESTGLVEQRFSLDGKRLIRVFEVDVIEPNRDFALATETDKSAEAWFQRESGTLGRYTEVLS